MAVTITTNSKYSHFNADRSHAVKPGGVGVEREMVCDIAIATEDLSDATIGNFVADFTQVGFKQVYYCKCVDQDDLTDLYFFNEAAGSDAATASIDVVQIADGTAQNSASYTANITVHIRGV